MDPIILVLPNCSEFSQHLDRQVPTFSCIFLKHEDNIFPPVTMTHIEQQAINKKKK